MLAATSLTKRKGKKNLKLVLAELLPIPSHHITEQNSIYTPQIIHWASQRMLNMSQQKCKPSFTYKLQQLLDTIIYINKWL